MNRADLALAAVLAVAALAGCTVADRTPPTPSEIAPVPPRPPAPPPSFTGPVLTPEGGCTGAVPGAAAEIEPGIGECELVRLKGRAPTDVLIGEGRAGREVQVLYTEPGAKELYFFVNNRLDRVVKS
ncbi:hypothetical protein [Methylobacterium gregans]|uniref:Lipoprotein n=1 Tax=Methylobacterium gregans TaxID=374424 RepID=A0AA37HK60_9HYPH|nr:hypothetical protein [Methylobacterium gregans]MDQ0519797.1 hypothetical protein [Methylobacterium gregans]GJD76955.1 hypothetical protein NBEOAGPD_0156 [Methylobacterium gregans]GLS54081.1 hypothetical protein GCM10007886_22640 [Methylobacterium gregans]